jgi:hypothetical protein
MWHINPYTQELIVWDSLTTRLLRNWAVNARGDLLCRHLGNNRILIDIQRKVGVWRIWEFNFRVII